MRALSAGANLRIDRIARRILDFDAQLRQYETARMGQRIRVYLWAVVVSFNPRFMGTKPLELAGV